MRPDWLQQYVDLGFRLVFYPTKTKGPQGADAKGWTTRTYDPDEYVDGQNVGVMLGHEISDGKFLADVDLDWPDGIRMVRRLLPITNFGFGRPGKGLSHLFYTTPKPLESVVFKDVDDSVLVELRGTKKDGSVGLQTMIPPSIHPSGELVQFPQNQARAIAHTDVLHRCVTLYAIACIILKHVGHRGLLHDVRLALAGFLLQSGLTEDEATAVGQAVAEMSGNSIDDVATTVHSTAARIRRKEKVQGSGVLGKAIGDAGQRVCGRIREWLGGSEFVHDKEGIAKNDLFNIELAIERMGLKLYFNELRNQSMVYVEDDSPFKDRYPKDKLYQFDDSLATDSWIHIKRTFGFLPNKDFYYDVSNNLARANRYHPIKKYLSGLKWDGVPRLNRWLVECAGAADTEYVQAVSSIVLIAAVRRIKEPGCKFDEMLILESEQGLQKSTALSLLCVDREWFSDDLPLDVEAKELIERTAGKWIIEASELQGMSTAKMESIKALLSRSVDGPVRQAYGRISVEKERQFIFIGTTNGHAYLSDFTGNRRFWPVRIVKFDLDWIRANRDQLWAEASSRESAGESIRLPEHLYEYAGMQQERRRTEDPWEEKLASAFRDEFQRLAPSEIWEALGIPTERRDERGQRRINQVMQRLGYRRMTVKDKDGNIVKGWARGTGKRDKFVFDPEHEE